MGTSTTVEASYWSADWFSRSAHLFPSGEAKINFIIGLLRSRALTWAQASCASERLSALTLEFGVCEALRVVDVLTSPVMRGCASYYPFQMELGLYWSIWWSLERSRWSRGGMTPPFRVRLEGVSMIRCVTCS